MTTATNRHEAIDTNQPPEPAASARKHQAHSQGWPPAPLTSPKGAIHLPRVPRRHVTAKGAASAPTEALSRRIEGGSGHQGPQPIPVRPFPRRSQGRGGGKAVVAEEGVSRIQVKNRVKAAAKAVGVKIAFQRTEPEIVVFRVVAREPMAPAAQG